MRGALLLLGLLAGLPARAAPADATLVVRADGLEAQRGTVRVAVCTRGFDEAGCPGEPTARREGRSRTSPSPACRPGRYAIAVYQDLNGNGRLDTIPPGLPTEPYGFSNDVGRIAPPSFERALVAVEGGRTVVEIHVRRLLASRRAGQKDG